MRILVMSSMAWDDTNSIGNTFSNWFSGKAWERDEFFHLYLRGQLPNNPVCKNYYKCTVFEMANLLKDREKIGTEFLYTPIQEKAPPKKTENRLISILHKAPLNIVYWGIDAVYRTGRWKNNKFKAWIEKAAPDVVFLCVTDVSFINGFAEYIKENTHAKRISYISDDFYTQFKHKPLYRRARLLKEYENIIKKSDRVMCASYTLKNFYEGLYGIKCDTIFKGCKVSEHINERVGDVLQIVYAGNLFYGRGEALFNIINAIRAINKTKQKFFLRIYCGDDMPEQDKEKYSIEGVAQFCGKVDYTEICEIEHRSDLVLVAESFEEKNKISTRYSFSTKIPDSLQSGCNVLGIGPNDISSIAFLKKLEFAYVIDDADKIKEELEKIYADKENFIERRCKAKEFVRRNFEMESNCALIRSQFEKTFEETV